jgi:uncharacterized protein YabN with tetrapyrrole methylase and pyrophosphatase domain
VDYPHYRGEPKGERDWFDALCALARYLRTPDGCPWDREQSSADFAGYAQGEVAELIEALRSGDNQHAGEEFGDVFFTLLASAAAAEEEGRFDLVQALERVHDKMIRRHQHVFGDEKAETPEDAVRVWEAAKAREKQHRTG